MQKNDTKSELVYHHAKSMTYKDTVYLKMYILAMHIFFGGKVNKYVYKREFLAFKYLFIQLPNL